MGQDGMKVGVSQRLYEKRRIEKRWAHVAPIRSMVRNQLDRAYLHLLIRDRGVRDWTCRAFSIGVDGKRNLASQSHTAGQ
jgi:hypothetical protein